MSSLRHGDVVASGFARFDGFLGDARRESRIAERLRVGGRGRAMTLARQETRMHLSHIVSASFAPVRA